MQTMQNILAALLKLVGTLIVMTHIHSWYRLEIIYTQLFHVGHVDTEIGISYEHIHEYIFTFYKILLISILVTTQNLDYLWFGWICTLFWLTVERLNSN